jgi:hypothetical protein
MIHLLQEKLEEIYRLEKCPEANKYVLSPKEFKRLAKSSDNPQVIYVDEGSDATLGIYLGKRIFKKIQNKAKIFSFQDFCVMAEEISHFIYLIWSKSNGKKITLLDLEIQAEVDKFLLASNFFRSQETVFQKMFETFMFRKNLLKDEKNRYIEASRLGKKLATNWKNKKISLSEKIHWLRFFYRQNPSSRIAMIERGLYL